MLCYPEVQQKGQKEIDRVIGPDRLPTFDDFDSLPYVGCVTQEVLRCGCCSSYLMYKLHAGMCRWHPALPIGKNMPAIKFN